jgi:hypothetical protein
MPWVKPLGLRAGPRSRLHDAGWCLVRRRAGRRTTSAQVCHTGVHGVDCVWGRAAGSQALATAVAEVGVAHTGGWAQGRAGVARGGSCPAPCTKPHIVCGRIASAVAGVCVCVHIMGDCQAGSSDIRWLLTEPLCRRCPFPSSSRTIS